MDRLLAAEDAFVDDYFFCPHHPDPGFPGEVDQLKVPCKCRKPDTDLAEQARIRHRIDLTQSVMIGDTDRDRGLSRGTGMNFVHVSTTCSGADKADCFPESAVAIRRGIELLGC